MSSYHSWVNLQPYNTFGVLARARYFACISSIDALLHLLADNFLQPLPKIILGGGSNWLFRHDIDGLVLFNNLRGIEVVLEDEYAVWLRVMSGENWHGVVLYAVERGWGGIENLSLIPGTIGAAPVQNIGAYSVELQEVFVQLEAICLYSGERRVFEHADCSFGYRDSVFKGQYKGQYFIVSVTLRLLKKPVLRLGYGDIMQTLQQMGIENPSIGDVSKAVCSIRERKLPDPKLKGNAGSFFKNPVVSSDYYDELCQKYPEMPAYSVENGRKKIPAAWLIEYCGWRGKREGDAGVHEKHALVLVNHGQASGEDIYRLSLQIQTNIFDTFGIELEAEVNIW